MIMRLKYFLRGIYLAIESRFFGVCESVVLPNSISVKICRKKNPTYGIRQIIKEEIEPYWRAYEPKIGELHLDIGAQIGSYALLAATCGATVFAFEPDSNNRRFLKRNLKGNNVNVKVVDSGVWNKSEILKFRSHDALSSIEGVGMIPSSLPAINRIKVDTIDNIVKRLGIKKIDVIKMDIEGAEIEAIEGASNTILKDRPILLIEAYHLREGQPTLGRVLTLLHKFGIPEDAITVSEEMLVVVKNY